MDCSTPGFHDQLPELAQTHVHQVCDSIQPSHSLSSPVIPFSSCLQSCPASGAFPMSQFSTSSDQSIPASASALPMTVQCWFPLRLTGLILLSKGLSRVSFDFLAVQKDSRESSLICNIEDLLCLRYHISSSHVELHLIFTTLQDRYLYH